VIRRQCIGSFVWRFKSCAWLYSAVTNAKSRLCRMFYRKSLLTLLNSQICDSTFGALIAATILKSALQRHCITLTFLGKGQASEKSTTGTKFKTSGYLRLWKAYGKRTRLGHAVMMLYGLGVSQQ
jgi:hypothetical protein